MDEENDRPEPQSEPPDRRRYELGMWGQAFDNPSRISCTAFMRCSFPGLIVTFPKRSTFTTHPLGKEYGSFTHAKSGTRGEKYSLLPPTCFDPNKRTFPSISLAHLHNIDTSTPSSVTIQG